MRSPQADARENYLETLFAAESALKKQSRKAAADLGLARISLSANEGLLLSTLLKLHRGKKCVEIGTLTGLSAQYIFEALPEGGELWTLEKSPEHAAAAEKVFAQLSRGQKKLHLVIGDARFKLEELSAHGPFDIVFIDGNKAAYGDYLVWAEKNLRTGGLILADNVFLSGAVWGEATTQKFSEKQIQVLQNFNRRLADPEFFESVLVPTDEGLFVAIKKSV